MMMACCRQLVAVGLLSLPACQLLAGGSGLNVAVVVNQNSTNSVQLGNYYVERRQIPPQNYLRINWLGGNIDWTESDFDNYLYNSVVSALASRQLTNQIEFVVLSMDIPYRVDSSPSYPNSTTSSLFYGFKPDTNPPCSIAKGSTNLYAGSEGIFRQTPPISASSNSWLVTMITHSNLALAKQIVESGVLADGSFPTQTVFLAKSGDGARNVRYWEFDNVMFDTRLRGNYLMQRSLGFCCISPIGLGMQQGTCCDTYLGTTYVPGSLADNLTSYGGGIFQDIGGQLNILQFLSLGAAGTYGTVTEPCNYLEKFPSAQNYFYQSRGFALAECYYQSVTNPYQGLLVGEPLSAPFALPPAAAWNNLPLNALLSGTTNLTLQATAVDGHHPLQQVDLFLDGLWLQTITNIPPSVGNVLTVTLNGQPISYVVPAPAPTPATIKSVTSGLTTAINGMAGITKVSAFAHGDRIELQSTDRTRRGPQVSLSVSNTTGAGATTWLAASGTNFLDTVAYGLRNFLITAPTNPVLGSFLHMTVTKTNGGQFTFGVTNTSGNLTLIDLAPQLVSQINASPDMAAADGLVGDDLLTDLLIPFQAVEFNLYANTLGWDAAQIQASLTTSFTNYTPGTLHLEDNLSDLEPRAHLYVTAGVTNWPLTFAFNTTVLANGFHELTAVVYEGSHVRTQKRVSQTVVIQNGPLSASFTSLFGGTNVALEATNQFSVVVNTNNISRIELFSTGGSLGFVTGVSNAVFSVPGTSLDLGLHPFYAIVTASSGKQYRTETRWFRIVGPDAPFRVALSKPPPALAWPATAGRSYDVLCATNVTDSFQVRATVVPTNSSGQWTDTNAGFRQRFYRVRTSN
jgi:uncharacterized protein (TIGR03790 family)